MLRLPTPTVFAAIALIGLALTLGLPGAASAATPDVTTFDTYSTGATTATVEGLVDPGGESTTYAVKYDTAASTWCSSGGASGSPGHTTAAVPLDFTDAAEFVSVDLSGLLEKGNYCAELIATNGSGEGDGEQVSWTQGAPTADTFDAFTTDQTTATVQGDVNPAGLDTTYEVQYDLASSTWCTSSGASGSPAHTTTPTDLGSTDATFQDVFVNLSGLSAAMSYCATVMASNSDGTGAVSQLQWVQGAPGAKTLTAWSTGATDATVFGAYNPEGSPGNFQVVYDVAASTWCTSGGTSGSPAHTSGANQYSFADTQYNQISVELTGLTEGTDYCGAMETTNGVGTTVGTQVQWTQGAPGVGTTSVSGTSATTASVFSNVNPAEKTTTYRVVYGLATSNWCESGGVSGSPGLTTASTALSFTDGTFHGFSVDLTGLTEGTDYCAELIATNADGETDSDQTDWTQTAPPPPPPDLFVSVTGAGTVTSSPAGIDCGNGHPTCSAGVPLNSPVTLTATPAPGSTLSGWVGAPTCGTKTTCTITLFGTTSIGVVFTTPRTPQPRFHTLMVATAGTGSGSVTSSPAGIDCGSTCSHAFTAGTQVTLAATPTSSSRFAGWSGGGCSGTGTCTVTMTADQTVTATFLPPIGPGPVHTCKVPKVEGKKLAAAKTALRHAHCAVGKITKTYSTRVKKGRVVSSKPGQGTRHRAGTKVKLVVSKGRKPA